jgi:pimeloyl-ACP methyl ester carboxylesterase
MDDNPLTEPAVYDEMAFFHDNATEFGLAWTGPPQVTRVRVELADGRHLSGLRWGARDAEVEGVLVHGGAQNAHTWDTVALALDRPLLAIDLPGHGHSAWRPDGLYSPGVMAEDLAVMIDEFAPRAAFVAGMSLGGLTSLALADRRPDLVEQLVLVDITPGVNRTKAAAVIAFVDGPQSFDSFDALLERTIAHHPTRSVSSLRRGILHNAHRLADGTWAWRYDRGQHTRAIADGSEDAARSLADGLWDALSALDCRVTLVRGGDSPVVDDEDVAEFRRRRPDDVVNVVEGAGHSVQGDRPVELASVLNTYRAR